MAAPRSVLFGAAYYYEYKPGTSLERDFELMSEASFTVIRVGESVWSTWEPENGRFDLDWMQPILDAAAAHGIGVVLGTPTYAVPPWLARQYPEIAGESATGVRIPWGARQEVDYTHPTLKFHAERVIRKILDRYADHPAVIGFQVDNEPGTYLMFNEGIFQRFVDHLRHEYGDVETLNEEWGLVYWSHRLSTWADLWRPDGNMQAQYDLAWRKFQAAETAEFIGWQADIVREYAKDEQFVTTCIAYDRPGQNDEQLSRRLSITSGNAYFGMQDQLLVPDPRTGHSPAQRWMVTGTWGLYERADRMFASRQEPFLVTETNAQAIGKPWENHPAYEGQWRQAAWALVSRGASMIEYWHWHTLHFGTETYWGGVLPHDGEPDRTFDEIATIGRELRTAGADVVDLTPGYDVVFLYSNESKWALEFYPALADEAGNPYPRSYERIFDPFYRGAFESGLQSRLMHVSQLSGEATDPAEAAERIPVLVVPALFVCSDETLDWLAAYAVAGGHLVLGPRSAYGDLEARARSDAKPSRLSEAAGVRYSEFSNLDEPVPVRGDAASSFAAPPGSSATLWADGLRAQGAEVVLRYDHPHFARFAAVTTKQHGAGRVTMVGTVPDNALARSLFDWLVPRSERDAWHAVPPSVTSTSATSPDGRTLRFLHNWAWDHATVQIPAACRDVTSGARIDAGTALELGSWDVRVLVEEPDRGDR